MITKILAVDDCQEILNITELALADFGWEVFTAKKYLEATSLLIEHKFYAAILDYNLRETKTGLDILWFIKGVVRPRPLIYANSGNIKHNDKMLDSGADGVIGKSIFNLNKFFERERG